LLHSPADIAADQHVRSGEVIAAETAVKAFCFHPHAQTLFQQHPEGLLLDTRIDSYEWFTRWLVQLSFPFTVLETAELKEALTSHARRLIEACEGQR
jgi:hypothetical protein